MRVAVVGLGRSGVAAARLCMQRGDEVTGVDQKPLAELSEEARALRIQVIAHGASLDAFDLIVVSPGVPQFESKAPIWSEIELAYRRRGHACPIVAVGGTNGKSTVTSLIAALLEAGGKKVFAGGNLGEPWAAHVDEEFDVVVLEVSSFQMERLEQFRPDVAVLLNITDDHLDRYASFADYAHAKGNCFMNQTEHDLAVVPRGDELSLEQAKRGNARVVTFGSAPLGMPLRLQGAHNALNASAAVAAIEPFAIPRDVIARVLETFEGLPHRMALVANIDGVAFYDDSKGTNVGASVTALLGLREPKVVLIAGGRDKQGTYAPLADAMKTKGRAAIVIGEAANRIESALAPVVRVEHATTMDDAVKKSASLAERGDAVLLSPACSSFDMFRDYKHRGDEFVRAVRTLRDSRSEAERAESSGSSRGASPRTGEPR